MKNKELIAKLQTLNPELEVYTPASDEYECYAIVEDAVEDLAPTVRNHTLPPRIILCCW